MKKIIILDKPKGARLANQLWNYVSIYAYCLERGFKCRNYSFFEDKKQENKPNSIKTYFNLFQDLGGPIERFFLFFHVYISRLSSKPRIYFRYVEYIKKKYPNLIISSGNESAFLLPPTDPADTKHTELIKKAEEQLPDKIYFDGWLFRNPAGIEKYRAQLVDIFRPNNKIKQDIDMLVTPLKKSYEKVVGVHIRQGDYKKLFEGGRYYFSEEEVRKIIDEYLEFYELKKETVVFLLCSDENINTAPFESLNIKVSEGNEAHDLFALSNCDVILGSQSTYGPFAALYGNIPFIMFERCMDWEYYKPKNMEQYFDNEKVEMLK